MTKEQFLKDFDDINSMYNHAMMKDSLERHIDDLLGCENEELEKVINFEENWLINLKLENGFISIADVVTAMNGIRSAISERKRKR